MPHMYERLSSGWAQLLALPAAAQPQPSAPGTTGATGASTSEEVLTDTLLREVRHLTSCAVVGR